MKQGRTIIQLAQELERQRLARKDYLADTRNLEVETDNGISRLTLGMDNATESFILNELAHKQLADRLQIPQRYYNKMRTEYPELLDDNINSWFNKSHERRMLRTLDGNVRAFLSDRYRRLDNLELADAVLPIINEMKSAEIMSSQITETHMYIKVINKKLKAEVAIGDVVQAGIVISNSEVGLGSLKVEPLLYRLVCKNGLIVKDYAQKRYHVGKQIESEDSAYEIFSDETLAQDDKAFFMKVQDTVRTAIDEVKFNLSVEKLSGTMYESTGPDPVKTVEILADQYILNQNERGSILRHFIMEGDNSKYGLINAVTRASQDIEDYTRATDLERLGGELLSLSAGKNKLIMPPIHSVEKNITNVIPLEMAR
ncbi:hypothetical protein SPSIL_058000 [Sporomusa silvacetica DSM 10669]|uniref:DUF932 domain-containing protein n=1 Tax=Sporomusa silvacetica DSM 10669 TaxID=1123289 RepID=A0ABZ3IV13_9FIRM|nr:DUF932 domain-containing protein [Sporomusa silvacetica]OZC14252.1 hypothetical protein SPSIL_49790 [Sporomusa silvacetica DSM 10669]